MDELQHHLQENGCKVSKKKAQICQRQVKYLGFILQKGERRLEVEQKQFIYNIPVPTTRRQVIEFLGAVRLCCLWIPNFAVVAKPLYEATKWGEKKHMEWWPKPDCAFRPLKKITSGPGATFS